MEKTETPDDALEMVTCSGYLEGYGLVDPESCYAGIGLEQLEQLLAEADAVDNLAATATASATSFCSDLGALPQLLADECGPLYASACATTAAAAQCSYSGGSAASTGSSSAPTSPLYSASDTHSPAAQSAVQVSHLQDGLAAASQQIVAVTSASKLSPLMPSASSSSDVCSRKKRKLGNASSVQMSCRAQGSDDGLNYDGVDETDSYNEDSSEAVYGSRTIKWHLTSGSSWHQILDKLMAPVHIVACQLDADKGINYSSVDSAFISQKKNHFQVTCTINLSSLPRYVVMPDQTHRPVDGIYMHMYGVKKESPTQIIRIEQSQADRTKKMFEPMLVSLDASASAKLTIARLHFMETTNNNMRKKGKPNPDQRYFQLIVGFYAYSQGAQYLFSEYSSDKIIVRASNPGQFESEPEVLWQKGTGPDSVFHFGQVGVNCDRPDEALVVNGNVKVMGRVLQPSDERVKSNITEVDTREQLSRLAQLRMYRFRFREEFGDVAGLSDDELSDTGVLAQELCDVMPDAVRQAGDVVLSNGELVENLLVVNKERLFMESVGAVKELCKVTETLESRVIEIEKINGRLARAKRQLSVRSTTSSSAGSSVSTADGSKDRAAFRKEQEAAGIQENITRSRFWRGGIRSRRQAGESRSPVVSRRMLQNIVITLVVVMCLCLGAIVALYLLEKHGIISTSSTTANLSNSTNDGDADDLTVAESTTSPAACNSWSLITTACASASWSCPHVCGGYDISMSANGLNMSSTAAAEKDSGSSSNLTGSGPGLHRRRRSMAKRELNGEPQWPDLFEMLTASITDSKQKSLYNFTRGDCLTCDIYCVENCNNYTLILFVHTSFPATDIVSLRFSPTRAYAYNRTLVIASCGLSWDTTDMNSTCLDSASADSWSALIAQGQSQPTQGFVSGNSYELPKSFVVPVGMLRKSIYKFRIGFSDTIKEQNICSLSSSSPDFVEINIDVVRTTYRCIDSLMSQLHADISFLYFLQIPLEVIDI